MKTASVMEDLKPGYQVWAIVAYLLTTSINSVSSMKLRRYLGVTRKTAWCLTHRLRKSFESGCQIFDGIAEADEFCFGGFEKNDRRYKKLNAGRGVIDKEAFAGLKDRKTNQITAKAIENTRLKTLHGFIGDNVEECSAVSVYTDHFMSYRKSQGYDHRFVKRSVGEHVDENIHIDGMESFWSVLKRTHKGTFHKIRHKHFSRRISESAGRYSIRPFGAIRQMERIVRRMAGNRLKYGDLISSAGGRLNRLPARCQ